MLNIKFIYNKKYIDNLNRFKLKIKEMENTYHDNFTYEESDDKKFDLIIDNKIVYTLDDHFSKMKVPTDAIIDKIDQHIFNIKSSKKNNQSSKFDDIGLIDY